MDGQTRGVKHIQWENFSSPPPTKGASPVGPPPYFHSLLLISRQKHRRQRFLLLVFSYSTPPPHYNIGLENSRTDNSTCCRGCTWYFNRDFRFRFRFRFRSLCDPLKKKERGGGKNSTVSSRLLSPARSFITPFLFHHGFFLCFYHPLRTPFVSPLARNIALSGCVLLKPLLLSRERSSGINGEFSFLFLFFFSGHERVARNFAGNKLLEIFGSFSFDDTSCY